MWTLLLAAAITLVQSEPFLPEIISPTEAIKPGTVLFIHVDLVMVNYIETIDELEPDVRGRPRYERKEQVWYSFWNDLRCPFGFRYPMFFNRGWIDPFQVESVTPTTSGYMIQLRENRFIHCDRFIQVDSDRDVELSARRFFDPINWNVQ